MLLHRHFEQNGDWIENVTTSRDVTPVRKPTKEGMDMPVHVTPPVEPVAQEEDVESVSTQQRRGRPRRN